MLSLALLTADAARREPPPPPAIAAIAAIAAEGEDTAEREEEGRATTTAAASGEYVLLDACCGSGTLAAAAAACGRFRAVVATDVSEAFASRARENVAHVAAAAAAAQRVGEEEECERRESVQVEVLVHNAASRFPPRLFAPPRRQLSPSPLVVVANPPWGWRLKAAASSVKDAGGDGRDGARSLLMNSESSSESAAAAIVLNLLDEVTMRS